MSCPLTLSDIDRSIETIEQIFKKVRDRYPESWRRRIALHLLSSNYEVSSAQLRKAFEEWLLAGQRHEGGEL